MDHVQSPIVNDPKSQIIFRLGQMIETGEIRKIIMAWKSNGGQFCQQGNLAEPLGIEAANVPFLMIAFVLALSIVILVFETLIAKTLRRSSRTTRENYPTKDAPEKEHPIHKPNRQKRRWVVHGP